MWQMTVEWLSRIASLRAAPAAGADVVPAQAAPRSTRPTNIAPRHRLIVPPWSPNAAQPAMPASRGNAPEFRLPRLEASTEHSGRGFVGQSRARSYPGDYS